MEITTLKCGACMANLALPDFAEYYIKGTTVPMVCEYCETTNLYKMPHDGTEANITVQAGGVNVKGNVGGSIITGNLNAVNVVSGNQIIIDGF